MKIGRIHHLIVQVSDLGIALEDFREKLGIDFISYPPEQDTGQRGVLNAHLPLENGQFIELVQPVGEGGAAIARAIERRGEGIHMICITTPNPTEARAELQQKGVRTIDDPERPEESFLIHPGDTHGLLFRVTIGQENWLPKHLQ